MALIEWKKKSLLLNKKSWISFRDNRLIFWFCLFYLAILKKVNIIYKENRFSLGMLNKIVKDDNFIINNNIVIFFLFFNSNFPNYL